MPRNAAQLRRDATATGYFNGPKLQYVGDGYTVPWEVALPFSIPLGMDLLIYKSYLDRLDLEASRLHDWLYTPYGKLIDVTRDEADNALREELAEKSVADSLIVYAAVRAGGFPFFGTSQTGYAGFVSDSPYNDAPLTDDDTRNIVLAPQAPITAVSKPSPRSNAAMPIKCVLVLQCVTTPGVGDPEVGYAPRAHIGGWTESLWANVSGLADAQALVFGPRTDGFPPLAQSRALMLPVNASVLGCRFYQGGAGKGIFLGTSFNGPNGTMDVPQAALLWRSNVAGNTSVRRFTTRCLPDEQVTKGEYSPTGPFTGATAGYTLALNGFGFYGVSKTNGTTIFTIDNTGLVTLNENRPYLAGDLVTISQALDVGGIRRSGKFMIDTVGPNNKQFHIIGWTFGPSTGGACSQNSKAFNALASGTDGPTISRVVTRKVGRPFEQYHGRRSRKRKAA